MATDPITPAWLAGSDRLEAAYELATEAHAGQEAKDGHTPYIAHPLAVAERVAAEGADEQVLAAAILHDAVESSELGLDTVVARFGVRVGELVSALTDDPAIAPYDERKREHRARVAEAGPAAATIYAADKLVNVRELRALYAKRGEAAASRLKVSIGLRVELWHEDLAMLDDVLGRTGLVDELAQELRGFSAERPGEHAHADAR